MKQFASFDIADARLVSKTHKETGEVKYFVRLDGESDLFAFLTPLDVVNKGTWKSLKACTQEVDGPDGPFTSRYAYLSGYTKYTAEVTVEIPDA